VNYAGQTLDGRYTLVKLLGEGGMGSVYLGQHTVIGKQLAVKFLHPQFISSEEVLKRFYREAQAAAAIGHKNIIEVIDVGVAPGGEPYLVMEYLEGEDLETTFRRTGRFDLPAACAVLEPVLHALGAAHRKGIVHRDLKPANIFITHMEDQEPTVKLIDFGISKFTGDVEQTKLTQTGSLLGTPAYMSPEQARGIGEVDHRTDLYAVGVILYQLLTAKLPYEGESYNDLLVRVLTEDYRPPSDAFPGFPEEAEPVIAKALAKDPDQRFADTAEMLAALDDLVAFNQRRESFTLLVSGMESHKFAGGDLGSRIDRPGEHPSATSVLADIARQGTPSAWAGTDASGASGKKKLAIGIAVGVVVVVGVIVGLVVGLTGKEEPPPPVVPIAAPQLPKLPPDQGVEITVEGAPEGAKIYWDNAPVPMNPFRVKEAGTLTTLKVEAEGFEPYLTSVVPSKDQQVAVELKAKEAAPAPVADESAEDVKKVSKKGKKKGKAGAKVEVKEGTKTVVITETAPKKAPKKEPKKPAKKEPKPEPKKKISEGGKGTLYSEDFD
jgi:serine/threonine-protein kinase